MKITEVAAAVITRPDGSFLLAQRPEGKPYPGYWEFPGGKIEPGESAYDALKRELQEELDITITHATPWITRVHAYTHATVRLQFFRVTAWEGEPRGLEDQAHVWQTWDHLTVSPMLPANTPIFRALAVPRVLLISNAHVMGPDAWLTQAQAVCEQERTLVLFNEPELALNKQRFRTLLERSITRLRPFGAKVVIGSECGDWPQADGIHLSGRALASLQQRPQARLCGATIGSSELVVRANECELDYVLVNTALPEGPPTADAVLRIDRQMPAFVASRGDGPIDQA